MKLNYCAYYQKGKTEKNIKELLENFENKPHNSKIKIDTLDLCDIFGYIKHLEKENSIYQTMFPNDYEVRILKIKNYWLDHDLKVVEKRIKKGLKFINKKLIPYGDEWYWDDGYIRDLVIELKNILRGNDNVKK